MWFSFRIARGMRVSMPWWLALPVFAVMAAVVVVVFVLEALVRGVALLATPRRAQR